MTALTLPVILVTTAFCVDIGRLYLARGKAEIAATLAVEAALERHSDLVSAQDIAERIALAAVQDAGFVNDLNVDLKQGGGQMSVTVKLAFKTAFAGLFGYDSFTTGSSAIREIP